MAKLICMFFVVLAISATVWAEGCDKDRKDMIRECAKYQKFPKDPKQDPSEACCAVWQRADIPCLCKDVTKEMEKVYCMEKVAYVAKFCKRPFPSGYKCGSYTFPLGQ